VEHFGNEPVELAELETSLKTYPYLPVLLAADLGNMMMLIVMVNRDYVRQAADEYASALFRTLDQA
jgi:hypothetical protein